MINLINNNGTGYIPIPYNNPRVVVPKGFVKGFNVYHPSSFKGKLQYFLIKLIFPLLRKQVGINEDLIKPIYDKFGEDIKLSIYTGTKGYHRKPTIMISDKNGFVLGYAKMALTKQAKLLIFNEYSTLNLVAKLNLKSCYVPKVLFFNKDVLIVSTINAKPSKAIFDKQYSEFMNEIKAKTMKNGKCLVHGDFAPWNILIADKPFIFDWELSKYSVPLYDYFHFIVQTELLLKNSSAEKIFNLLKKSDLKQLKIYLFESIKYYELISNKKDNSDLAHIKVRKSLIKLVDSEVFK